MDTDDRVQCHACGRVWPRRLHDSLECPHCGSDFTEIIEIPPDTDPEPELSHPDPPETFPGHRSPSPPPVNPWTDHNPWARTDPGRDNGMHGWDGGPGYRYTQRTYRSPGGNLQFSFSAHSMPHRRVPSVQRGMGSGPAIDGLDSFFHGISELQRETAGINRERAARGHGPSSPFDDMYGAGNRTGHNQPHTGLFPRDADGPQPMDNPLRSLSDILQLFQSNLANTQTGPGGPHVRVVTGGGAPIGQLISTLLSMRSGDAVYSQEELDRIISQLAEQNGDRTAAPPASQDAIHALPKKAVTKDMLGGVESTECSICMDAVKVDDQVTVLPCTHWFHPQCIEMWLGQHNTCPHCRRAIDPTTEEATTTAPSEGNPNQTRRSDSFSRSSAHPSFDEEQGPSSRTSRGEGSGSWAGWVRSRLGGGD